MDKYEYRVKTEQMLEYMEKKQYKKAMEIADTIDWRRVKNASMLNNVSEIYEYNGEYQKSRDILFVAYDRSPGSRKIVYRLGILALKINDIEEASDCYEEFVKLAPKDPNQYILKYKILKARREPVSEQIAALEDFKKAEYVEKWAYELAKLYDEAGMTAECLEECDDLILWFSEGKYVYQAMELKMKYKPLTPLQQEKYNSMGGQKTGGREMARASAEEDVKPQEAEIQDELEEGENSLEQEDAPEGKEPGTLSEEEAATREIRIDELRAAQEKAKEETAAKPKEKSSISQTVKGATLSEALANGVRVAKGLDIEEKASTKQDEAMRITGQMKIEEILAEWEAKQKGNAEAIEEQRKKDEEKLEQRRLEAQRRREEEARRIEEQQRAAEEARKIAEQKAAEEARKLAEQKAEEERILAKQKADEEKRLAKLKEEEEEALLDRIASGKATEEFKEAVKNAVEPEEATEEAVEEITEEEIAEEADGAEESVEETEIPEESQDMSMTADLRQLMAELEEEDQPEDKDMNLEGLSAEESADEEISDYAGEEEAYDEADYDEGDYDEPGFEEDDGFEGNDDFEEEYDFDDEDEDEYADDEDEYVDDEDEYADDEDDYADEDEYDDLEDDMDDDGFDEEDDSDYDDIEDDEYDDDFYEEEETKPKKKQQEELVIEEPTEEEIQKRIKKGKGGVPFDTGFVVTGRYDLSATSEIGLKAGLTEEQKQLFSYFVPVRGMSEQIVEVLDNDRRERRNGTSKVGNILVIGHKGSGKTVLAVDIVKAIQKQRNLKQGKVAIVTGEALNKKDIPNIIQKLKGGAIIIEKAGKLNARTVRDLNILMEKKTGELLFVLEDQRKALERLFTANPEFKKKFTSKLELPVFVNDELVTFGQTYAKENGYKLDEMGILALYSRIDVMQREDHAVTVAEVKEIMDAAIEHSQKANVKHLARRMFRKGTDESDRIILKEDDFRI